MRRLEDIRPSLTKTPDKLFFPLFDPPFRVPITEGGRYSRTKFDPRIFAAGTVRINPGKARYRFNSERWHDDMELIASPLHKRSVPEGTCLASAYLLISKRTSHRYFINLSNNVAGFNKGEVVVTARQFDPNTLCGYLDQSYPTCFSTVVRPVPSISNGGHPLHDSRTTC